VTLVVAKVVGIIVSPLKAVPEETGYFRDGDGTMSGTRRKPGVMAPYIAGLESRLVAAGYTEQTQRNMLKVVGGRAVDGGGF
jgi:hypothetical protein